MLPSDSVSSGLGENNCGPYLGGFQLADECDQACRAYQHCDIHRRGTLRLVCHLAVTYVCCSHLEEGLCDACKPEILPFTVHLLRVPVIDRHVMLSGVCRSSPNKDATDIDWSLVDFFVPQLYGAAGTLPDGWQEYAQYWKDGAGKPNVHNVTFAPIPMDKFLWGMPAGTCAQGDTYGGSGCIEWAYSPGVH